MILPAVTIYDNIVNVTSDSGHSFQDLPKSGILTNSYCPSGVTKAVLCTSSGATGICQYPLVRSIFDKYFLPLSLRNKSSAVVMGSGSTSVILFNFQKSTHIVLEPSFFFTMTMGDAYGDVDGLTTPISSIVSTSFLDSSHIAYNKGYGLHLIGVSSVSLIWMAYILLAYHQLV